ncbi:DUF2929 family protein [Domibacillus sp.]|uniref:DUF2929 family protein n=1 Tax=Domibacillus sp. TaxID=1969783 RepID=UPI002811A1FB|nr:DUF2929 family protein [Domibacillus sp.]
MQYIMMFVWTFLLSEMTVYVISSMNGAPFHFEIGVFIAIVLTLLLIIVIKLIPDEPIEKH